MTKLKYRIIIGLMIFFQNCGNSNINKEYFVGTWKANDSAIIEIYEDGKCKVTGLNYYNIYRFEKYKNHILNFEGSWDFRDKDDITIHLNYYTGETYEYKGEIKQAKNELDFSIRGQGLLENKPPYDLYVFIGDPDNIEESNKYVFIKQ